MTNPRMIPINDPSLLQLNNIVYQIYTFKKTKFHRIERIYQINIVFVKSQTEVYTYAFSKAEHYPVAVQYYPDTW